MPEPKSHFDRLPAKRQGPVAAATKDCWPGTQEIVAEVVHESRGASVWKPMRAVAALAHHEPEVFMTTEEYIRWRAAAKGIARNMKLGEHPREILAISPSRYDHLGNARKVAEKNLRISKIEALAFAHYALAYPVPCDADGLKAWFWERFAQLASAADALNLTTGTLSAYLRGYEINAGEKVLTPASPTLIRALDWVWRNGPASPYGPRPNYYPSAEIPAADEET